MLKVVELLVQLQIPAPAVDSERTRASKRGRMKESCVV